MAAETGLRARDVAVAPAAWVEALIRGYAPLPDVPDELISAGGRPCERWMRVLTSLSELAPGDIEHRFALADRTIHDTGVSYRAHGETRERDWPLSRLPILVGERDWQEIEAGVAQRAELLDAVLKDVYGEGRLFADGLLPPAALAGSPEYLRPLVGGVPKGRMLHIYAADLGRGPDGRWWVLGDRAQAPSGAGYAVQNRLVLSRAFPAQFEAMNVERLAPFFKDLRDGLRSAAQRSEPRIGLLTPGPYSETYFEHAYLARYLGFLLVEGDDLTVKDGRVHVRTISGLKQVDVLWRRVDSDFTDPLELNASSRLGVPGLMQAMRSGAVAIVNAPGSGLIETAALLGFLPALCRRLTGADLKLPGIATWWCGQAAEREFVLDRLDVLAVRGAYGDTLPGFPGAAMVLGTELDRSAKVRLAEHIRARPIDYIGQEIVRLSTTPVWSNGRLEPRPFVLRVYAVAASDGWRVMPGGFGRIAARADVRAATMGEGAVSADVWVISDKPVRATSLLPARDAPQIRRVAGHLPSRAADNLFWLGRYLERGEATLRLVRALVAGRESSVGAAAGSRSAERLGHMLKAWGAVSTSPPSRLNGLAAQALHDEQRTGSVVDLARAARRAAASLRERLSGDTWLLVNELESQMQRSTEPANLSDLLDRTEWGLRTIAAVSGLSQENMNRGPGWYFLDMGRRIERGVNTCRFARQFVGEDATLDDLDVLLDLIDSQITYRSRYLVGLSVLPVRDMVALDPDNPRSIAFQVVAIDRHLERLPTLRADGILEAPRRLAVTLQSRLATEEADRLDTETFLFFEQSLMTLADEIGKRYFPFGPHAARPEKLTGLA